MGIGDAEAVMMRESALVKSRSEVMLYYSAL